MSTDKELALPDNGDSIPLTERDLEPAIDAIVQRSVDEKNFEIVFELGQKFIKVGDLSERGLGYLALQLRNRWNEFNVAKRFEEVAEQRWPNISKEHLNRVIRIAEMFQSGDVPKHLEDKFRGMGVRALTPIANFWETDYAKKGDWEKLSKATDDYHARDIVREITGKPPRKQTLKMWMDQEGQVYFQVGEGEIKYFATFPVDFAKDDSEYDKALKRVLNNARILY